MLAPETLETQSRICPSQSIKNQVFLERLTRRLKLLGTQLDLFSYATAPLRHTVSFIYIVSTCRSGLCKNLDFHQKPSPVGLTGLSRVLMGFMG